MALICVGHSHLVALSRGAAARGKSVIEFRLREISRAKGDQDDLDEEVDAQIAAAVAAEGATHLFCLVGGGTPAVLGLVQHPRRFDFILPERSDLPLDPEAELIPYDAMRQLMASMLRKHFRTLKRLSRLPARLVQLETPPPLFDSVRLASLTEDYNPDVAEYGISSPYLRYKIWRLHSDLFETYCQKQRIDYLKNPEEALDEAGFLADTYCGDFVHGNRRYGAAVLARLEAFG